MYSLNKAFKTIIISGLLALFMTLPGTANISRQAPDFEIKNLSGKPVRLADLRTDGRVLLVFWSTRCGYCKQMIPQFKAIEKNYRNKGVRLAAVNIGSEDKPEVLRYANKFNLPYLVLNDDAQKADLAENYAVVGTPTIILIEPTGEVSYRGFKLPDLTDRIN